MIQKHLGPSIQMCTIIVSQRCLANPYCHPEEIQIEDVLNTKPYGQHLELIQIEHLELIQIEDTVKQMQTFEIDSVVV